MRASTRRGSGSRRWVAAVLTTVVSAGLIVWAQPAAATGLSPTGTTLTTLAPAVPDLFTADYYSQRVVQQSAAGGPKSVAAVGNFAPAALAVGPGGDLYIGSNYFGSSGVLKFPASGGPPTTIESGGNPEGLAVDTAGDVYTSNPTADEVDEVHADGSRSVVMELYEPGEIAVDSAGDLFVVDPNNDRVLEVPVGGAAPFALGFSGVGLYGTSGIAVDAAGNVFLADTVNDRVVELPAGGRKQRTLGRVDKPLQLAVDSAGDVFVNKDIASVVEFPAAGGHSVQVSTGFNWLRDLAVAPLPVRAPAASPVSLKATVLASPGGSAPRGVVTFYDGSRALGTSPLSTEPPYTATLTASTLASGAHRLTALYSGDVAGNEGDLPSVSRELRVDKVPTGPTGVTLSAQRPPVPDVFIAEPDHRVVKVPRGGGSSTTVGSGWDDPAGVATDPTGDVFVADYARSRVVKFPVGGGRPVDIAAGLLTFPLAVAVDASGDVYIADSGNQRVLEVPAGGRAPITLASGVVPAGVAVNSAGDVYFSDDRTDQVLELPAGGGPEVSVTAAVSAPAGLAVDAAGDVFVADSGDNRVLELPADGAMPSVVDIGYYHAPLNDPQGVAVDAAGDVFIADTDNDQVLEVPHGYLAVRQTVTQVSSGLNHPQAVAVDLPPSWPTAGKPVPVVATVLTSPTAKTPTGMVTFFDGTALLASAPASGRTPDTASLSPSLAIGTHHLTAHFDGDAGDPPSPMSAPLTVVVH